MHSLQHCNDGLKTTSRGISTMVMGKIVVMEYVMVCPGKCVTPYGTRYRLDTHIQPEICNSPVPNQPNGAELIKSIITGNNRERFNEYG